ncbi:class I SAM-dependent methyltransferase [bacterium]|nr:class I SAM-dependent methyltransferase [bacterium]
MSNKIDFFKNLEPYSNCKDHTVSGEHFKVMINKEFEMLVTQPVPKNLSNYYQSEDYISHTDSKKTLFDKIYQAVKNITLRRKLRLINESLRIQNSDTRPEKNLLDVGAGTGDFLKICKNNSWNTFGIEPDEGARASAKNKGIVLQEDLSNFKNQTFEIITLWHVLEHVENLSEYISNLKKLLSNHGRLIIATPNFKSDDANYYKEFWAAFDVPRHLWHFSQDSIRQLFLSENMVIEKTIPMKFDSYYVSLLSEKYKKGRMNIVNALYRGFVSNCKAMTSSEYSSLIYVIKKR